MRSWAWRARRSVEFWWQRRTRGWDDSDLWNLDVTLAKMILPRLKRFAADAGGHPCDLSEEQWQAELAAMVAREGGRSPARARHLRSAVPVAVDMMAADGNGDGGRGG